MKSQSLLITILVMSILVAISFFFAYQKETHVIGLKNAWSLFWKTLPLIVLSFILVSFIETLISKDLVLNLIGEKSGIKGIFLGSFLGALIPGGPYIFFPLMLGVQKIGASIPVLVSIVTGRALLGFSSLIYEFSFLGPKLTFIRIASTIIFAPLAGLIASYIMKFFRI